jgi:hypothetical protein
MHPNEGMVSISLLRGWLSHPVRFPIEKVLPELLDLLLISFPIIFGHHKELGYVARDTDEVFVLWVG